MLERGGLLTREDLAAYEVVEREPAARGYRGREVLTNPPPSSGGILIADALGILERLGRPRDARVVAEVIASTNRARDEDFLEGLGSEGYLERFLAADALDTVATDVRSRLGSTTHVSVMDGDGALRHRHLLERLVLGGGGARHRACTSTTCSARRTSTRSAIHRHEPGARVPSMMAPTVVLRDGRPEVALGSAGSNRIRSAILQTILAVVDGGARAERGRGRPRVHVEGREVDAEPGVDPEALGGWRSAAGPCGAGTSRTSSSAGCRPWPATRDRRAHRRRRSAPRRGRRGGAD